MSNFSLYMILLYLLTLIAVILVRYVNASFGNLFALTVSLVSFGMAAFRPSEFPDVDTYEQIFEFVSTGDFGSPAFWLYHSEPGFKIILYFLHIGGLDYTGFLIVMALLSYILLIITSHISKISFAYLWFAYFSLYFVTRDLGVIRLSIASHLIVLSLLQRRFVWQIITVAFASFSFQYFAIVAMAAPILSRFKLTIFNIILLICLSVIIGSYINFDNIAYFVPEKQLMTYEETDQISNANHSIVVPVVRNLFFTMFLYWLMRKEIIIQKYNSWIWAALLSVLIYILAGSIIIIAQRFSAYFAAIFPLAFAFQMHKLSLKNSEFILIFFMCIFNFISVVYYNDFVWRL